MKNDDGELSPTELVSEMSDEMAVTAFSRSSIAMVITNPTLEDNPIIYVNRAFERLTGYSAEGAIGRNCRFLQGDDTDQKEVTELRNEIAAGNDVGVTLRNYRADGSEFRNALFVSPVRDSSGEIVNFIGIQRAVKESEDDGPDLDKLIGEIQHRVKNHLSMIVGLIRLQARQKSAEGDFDAISRRVESLQLLYEEMTAERSSRNTDSVSLGSYLSRVSNTIAHLDGRPGVRVNIEVDAMEVETDRAVHIGLIVSEVLTNALQHAFHGRESGHVNVSSHRTANGGIRVIVEDDGIGIPDDAEWPNPQSLGGRIVSNLVEGIKGGLHVTRAGNGTVITLDVPPDEDKVRDA